MKKNTLHIDGEYLKKANISMKNLKQNLKKILGESNYPTHLIYYSAGKPNKKISTGLSNLNIPNLSINTDGYIATLSDGKRIQKGVDSIIILNVFNDESDEVILLSGDGDMFPVAEAYYKKHNKKIINLSFKNNTSERLIQFSNHFYLNSNEKKDKLTNSFENIIYKAWITETKGNLNKYLSASKLGQLGYKNSLFKLTKIKKKFLSLANKKYIEIKKSDNINNPDTFIRFTKLIG